MLVHMFFRGRYTRCHCQHSQVFIIARTFCEFGCPDLIVVSHGQDSYLYTPQMILVYINKSFHRVDECVAESDQRNAGCIFPCLLYCILYLTVPYTGSLGQCIFLIVTISLTKALQKGYQPCGSFIPLY